MKQYTHKYKTVQKLYKWLDSFNLLQNQSVLFEVFSEVADQGSLEDIVQVISEELPQAVIINTVSGSETEDEENFAECVLVSLSIFDNSSLKSTLVKGNDSETIAALVSLIEVTKQENKDFADELSTTNKYLKLKNNALNASANGIVITDIDGKIEWSNDAYGRLTGYAPGESMGLNPRDLVNSKLHDSSFFESLWNTILSKSVWHGEIMNKRKDGSIYHEEMTITPMINEDGDIEHFVAVKQDISERKKMEELVHRFAFYDTLTQLPNRRLLSDRLSQVQAISKRSRKYGAVLFLDLDNFKPLNDTHGHNVGDLLLVEVASRIKECVRDSDTVSRFGGDEFVILLAELSTNKEKSIIQAATIAEKIRSTLEQTYILPIEENDYEESVVEHSCTCSIGISFFLENESKHDDILRWADVAMYEAKEAGRNQIRLSKY